jgi:hypothetical protein
MNQFAAKRSQKSVPASASLTVLRAACGHLPLRLFVIELATCSENFA